MPQRSPFDVLNQLLALHTRSLPTYLMCAKPWVSADDAAAMTVLEQIASDQQLMASRIAAVIREQGGTVGQSEFSMTFTDMHDLSMDYLVAEVQARQEWENRFMQQAVDQLADAPAPRAITEEALGAGKAHLDSLLEIGQPA